MRKTKHANCTHLDTSQDRRRCVEGKKPRKLTKDQVEHALAVEAKRQARIRERYRARAASNRNES